MKNSTAKPFIYAVLPRLWGNDTTTRIPGGSLKENGVGRLSRFTPEALAYIRSLGASHVWYIGLLEHATQTDYSAHGIRPDHPDTVKGVAGSPYAVKDYYDVDPDLAEQPAERMAELEALVERTHAAGLGFLMDFIPNHVARSYHSDVCPEGVEDLGAGDDPALAFSLSNNFYYLPGTTLELPRQSPELPRYSEQPARATGNDCFSPSPSINDWYETIKLNYGIDYLGATGLHTEPIPSTWLKMRDILRYWAAKGVDGFRCDMAELVPEAFWGWCLPQLKAEFPRLLFIAEIYQPHRYTSYLAAGFDYLYDKVGVYDRLIAIGCGEAAPADFTAVRDAVGALQPEMCYFMENHDEQRLASDFVYGDARRGFRSSLVAALSGTNPWMHYFAQELGERGMDAEGFSGRDGRTTIFDYWSLDKLQRLERGGWGTQYLTEEEAELLGDYRWLGRLLSSPIVQSGGYYGRHPSGEGSLAYLRHHEGELLLCLVSYAAEAGTVQLPLPEDLFAQLGLREGALYRAEDLRTGETQLLSLSPWAALTLELPACGYRVLALRPLEA